MEHLSFRKYLKENHTPEDVREMEQEAKKLSEEYKIFEPLNEAIEQNPKNAEAWALLAVEETKHGYVEQGLEDAEHAVELDPNCFYAYFARGHAKSGLGLYEEAEKDYSKAIIELKPTDAIAIATAYTNRGFVRIRLEKYTEAEKDCSKAIELYPNGAGGYNNLGIAKFHLGFWVEAKELLEKARDLAKKAGDEELVKQAEASLEAMRQEKKLPANG